MYFLSTVVVPFCIIKERGDRRAENNILLHIMFSLPHPRLECRVQLWFLGKSKFQKLHSSRRKHPDMPQQKYLKMFSCYNRLKLLSSSSYIGAINMTLLVFSLAVLLKLHVLGPWQQLLMLCLILPNRAVVINFLNTTTFGLGIGRYLLK